MEKNKHTPGQWIVSKSGPDKTNCRRAMVIAKLPNGNNETICVCHGLNGKEPGETAEANAALIATSPLLLEMCIATLEDLKSGELTGNATESALVNLRNAIALATTTKQ